MSQGYENSFTNQVDAGHYAALALTIDSLIGSTECAERCFLGSAIWDPSRAVKAAGGAGLLQTDFLSEGNQFLFALVDSCAELNRKIPLDVIYAAVQQFAPSWSIHWHAVARIVMSRDADPDRLESYAESLAEFKKRRNRLAELSRELSKLVDVVPVKESPGHHTKPSNHRLVRIRTAKGSRRVKYV